MSARGDVLLYPAMSTFLCILRCSERRLPRVWSSFFRTKSEVLDIPKFDQARAHGRQGARACTRKDLLLDLLLAIGEKEQLEAAHTLASPHCCIPRILSDETADLCLGNIRTTVVWSRRLDGDGDMAVVLALKCER